MSRIKNLSRAALILALGVAVDPVIADDPNPEPEYKTSTGRELNGPNTHHGEYTASPSNTERPRVDTVYQLVDTVYRTLDTVLIDPRSPGSRRKGAGAPVRGVDDKSATRPGE